ncbi:L,D-transpeptidase family protein [Acinetobacter larvae]|uniref:L,D-transpeptidase family protein n=1 Tax=Acinetobacter larvae TaxID=1789224 RepID=UPI001E549910|nr:L,D-transpeptidase [Acinetobacter larvae]
MMSVLLLSICGLLQAQPNSPSPVASKPTVAVSWGIDQLNQAQWDASLGRGQFPAYARAQVMLNTQHASPGAIDAMSGKNFLKALSAYQQMNALNISGTLDRETWEHLVARQQQDAFQYYTIQAEDLKGPYVNSIPRDYALQAKMQGLHYTRVSEMLAEKFHMDENFLKQINPKANFSKVGERIVVSNVRNELPTDITLIVAHKGARQLYMFNAQNQMVASFPASIGASNTPSPKGTHTITKVVKNPFYGYSPKNFVQGKNNKPLTLPPGPNGPVGNIWIALSKPSFGIHGTANPSLISKTASHGCIRLTNWDANDLGRKVSAGTVVKFVD